MKKLSKDLLKVIFSLLLFIVLIFDINSKSFMLYNILTTNFIFILYAVFSYEPKSFRKDKLSMWLGIILSIVYVIGYEYAINDVFLLNLNVYNILLYILRFLIMSCVFNVLISNFRTKSHYKQLDSGKLSTFLSEKNIIKIMMGILLCWSPYLILMYPCFIQADSAFELAQAFGIPNGCSADVKLLDPNQLITQHHSVLYTYLLKFFGEIDVNIGLYVFNFIQTIFIAFAIAKLIVFMLERLENQKIVKYIYILICVFPFFPFISTVLEKDTLFLGFSILFLIELYKYLNNENPNLPMLILTACFLTMLRNNFKYAILIFVILIIIKYKRKSSLVLLGALLLTIFGYSTFCSINKIPAGSAAEAYGVPILQVSKCVIEYKDELTAEEIEAIDKVLDYDKIEELFNAKNVDELKASWADRKPSDSDIKEFFKVWIQLGLKHPITYIESFLNKTMGYFYEFNPSIIIARRRYEIRNGVIGGLNAETWKLDCSKFGFQSNDLIINLSNKVDKVLDTIFNLPLIGLLTVSPTYIWIMIFSIIMLFRKKDYNNLFFALFLVLYLCTILLSPVDGVYEFRYIYPIFAATPIFICMWKKNNNSEHAE